MGIASMAGPLIFTQAFAAAVGPLSSWHVPGAPFLLAAVLLALALIVVLTAPDGKAPAHSG